MSSELIHELPVGIEGRSAPREVVAEIESHRSYLLRIARLQLGDRDAAEDAVQDTLLSALKSAADFAGRSSVKTWLISILKNKIIDELRRRVREPSAPTSDEGVSDPDEDFDALFNERGRWIQKPADWGDAEGQLEQKQFFAVLDACMDKLPPKQGRVFMLREVFELEAEEICKTLAISSSNLWVLLYRARMALRYCLDKNWFAVNRC